MYKKIVTVVMALIVASTLALSTPEPASAGFECYKHDHYHSNKVYKHDRKYKYYSQGAVWRKWIIKQKSPVGPYYHKIGSHREFCHYVDRA